MTASNRPRLSVEIDHALQERLQKNIPWGLQSHIVRRILEGVLDLLESNPDVRDVAIAAFISGRITVLDILRRIMKKDGPEQPTDIPKGHEPRGDS